MLSVGMGLNQVLLSMILDHGSAHAWLFLWSDNSWYSPCLIPLLHQNTFTSPDSIGSSSEGDFLKSNDIGVSGYEEERELEQIPPSERRRWVAQQP